MGPIRFTLDATNPAWRRLSVKMDVALGAPEAHALELFLPVWTPGSYLVREYSRHLSSFRATTTTDGTPLPWQKTRKNRYRVQVPAGAEGLRVHYEVYAHELSARTSDLTDAHACWNGATVFLWPWDATGARGDGPGPAATVAEVTVRLPDGWQLLSQLPQERDGNGDVVLSASGLDELVDSPCLAGSAEALRILEFEVAGKPHTLVLDGLSSIEPPARLVDDAQAVVQAAADIFGGKLPYDRYQFLCLFSDAGRGGLEHRASSLLLAPRTTLEKPKDYEAFLGLIAHEHFHVWNVKRMRPKELWKPDYENENYTELLWVCEGFTAYYDNHLCRRAGVVSPNRYLELVAKHIADLRRTPGRLQQSLAEASYDAWIRLYRPDENTRNSTLSYYSNGALVAMLLDLEIRQRTGGERSLDDAVRGLYERTYGHDRGFDEDDVIACLTEAAGTDLAAMVEELVHRPLDPDFGAALAPFGLELVEKADDTPYLGVQFKTGTPRVTAVLSETPADHGGLAPGDEVLALDGLRVTSASWSDVFSSVARIDTPLTVLVARRGRVHEVEVVPGPQPPGNVEIRVGADTTEEQDRLRQGWLFEAEG